MMGRTKEAEKMTNHILNEDAECLECYRLLSAIYSKQELYAKVPWHGIPCPKGSHTELRFSFTLHLSGDVSHASAHTQ